MAVSRTTSALFGPDGTRLAYSVAGAGAPMVLTNGLTTTGTFWKYLQPQFERTRKVVTWDMPGHGQSGPALSTPSAQIAGQPELLASIMDACGITCATQVGFSTGCQVVLEFYRRFPERCAGLVLLLGSAGRVLSTSTLPLPGPAIEWIVTHTPRSLFAATSRAAAQLANAPFGQALPRALGLIGRGTSRADAAEITAHLQVVDSNTVQTMVASAQAHSAWDMLSSIRVPVWIVAGDKDPFAPAETVGVPMARAIPDAKLLRLPEGSHTALLDHAEEIREFLAPVLVG